MAAKENISAIKYIGNKRSRELHIDACVWAKKMGSKNRIPFDSLLQAQGAGFRNGCGHCLKDTLQPEPARSSESRTNLIFFKSAIHHQGKEGNWPTYSVLSKTEDFDTNEKVAAWASKNKITKIFLILNGQQNPAFGHGNNDPDTQEIDDEGDRWFGRALTGGDKINKQCYYRIHASDEYNSVAHELYKNYVENDNDALIVDFLNMKYNWDRSPGEKEEVRNNTLHLVYDQIYSAIDEEIRKNIVFFICGFSRGAVFSLQFADMLHEKDPNLKIKAVVTIDPVIKNTEEEREEERLDIGKNAYGLWMMPLMPNQCNAYTAEDGHMYCEKRPISLILPLFWLAFFPILKGNSFTINYNVFQRLGIYSGQACKMPIGSAVKGAIAPPGESSADVLDVFNQEDWSINAHTPDMLDKYWKWILNIAFETMGNITALVILHTEVSLKVLKNDQPCPEVINRGETITLRVQLTHIYQNGPSQPAVGKPVTFLGMIYGLQYDLLGTAETDSNGKAECRVVIPNDAPAGEIYFKVHDNLNNSAVGDHFPKIPTMLVKYQANPPIFNQKTSIEFATSGEAKIRIAIYNDLNMHRITLADQIFPAGSWAVKWDGKNDSKYAFSYATKGVYTAWLTVSDKQGHQAEAAIPILLTKTQWKP